MGEIRNYGIDLAQKGKYEKALFYLRKAFQQGDYAASNDIGVVYERMGKYEKALDAYRVAADHYSETAVYNIGNLYEQGMGVTTNLRRAFVLYYRSMEMGYPLAYSKVAQFYLKGIEVKKDVRRGMKTLFKGIRHEDKDNPICTFYIGYDYECGIGVKQNYHKAKKYYKKAAKAGMPEALYNLAFLYLYRDGVKHDVKKGIELLKKASVMNYSDAHKELFLIYYNGELIKRDVEYAKVHLFRAMDLLNTEALVYLAELYLNGDIKVDDPKKMASEAIRTFLITVDKEDQSSLNAYEQLKERRPNSLDWEAIESNPRGINPTKNIANA